MDHPNIAKVLDAGVTETGRPYFVMERVKGVPITEYCDQNNLTTEQRLELFIQVCQAIQHAHTKGIIHRDIKPSNILVALQDGKPTPKVIDFGIAKATAGQRLTDKTLHTALAEFIGTPAYMSPEQAEMTGVDIDTRSDIYSLGVLLYELLIGRPPFEARRLIEAGLAGIRRIIREEEPARPSTRLSTLDAKEQTTVAKRRQSEPPRLIHQIRGDLDWIVMKTLEKDRTRRYETTSGLALDIQRHLEGEPVEARPPSSIYRLQKTVQRNRWTFIAVGAIVLALAGGLGATLWALFKARKAEFVALQEKNRAVSIKRNMDEIVRRIVFNGMGSVPTNRGVISLHGLTFELTRDDWIQAVLDQELAVACRDCDAAAALGIVLRPRTGDILAMSHFPLVNENEVNPCISLSTEPTSLLRFVVAAAAINEGLVTLNTEIDCEHGRYEYEGQLFKDHEAYGTLTVEQVLTHGSYIGSLKLGLKLGEAKLHDYFRRFGFGERAGIHLIGESTGSVSPLDHWSKRSVASMSMGYDIAATPLQACMAMAAVVNGGKLMTPRIIRFVKDEAGVELSGFAPELVRVVVSPNTANSVKAALANVLSPEGTAPKAALAHFMAGGVTGTLLVGSAATNHATFLGFLPVQDPEFVCLIHLVRPKKGYYGGQVAAPVFARVAEGIALFMNLEPEGGDLPPTWNSFAWMLATSTNVSLRHGALAVEFAKKAVTATRRTDAKFLDTLAAADAELGDFDQAIAIQNEAIAVEKDTKAKQDYAARLQLYEARKPYREIPKE
jgi:hypothetical protein